MEHFIHFKRNGALVAELSHFFRCLVALGCFGISSCSLACCVFPTGSAADPFHSFVGTEAGLKLGAQEGGCRDCSSVCPTAGGVVYHA